MITVERHQLQDRINERWSQIQEKSVTHFDNTSPAYRFTNEPLRTLRAQHVTPGPGLVITAAGDAPCLLAGLGVGPISAVDVCDRSNAWSEYKWEAFLQLSFEEFRKRLADYDARWTGFPFDLPVCSRTRELFAPFKASEDRIVDTHAIFHTQGYAASNPAIAGYLKDRKRYTTLAQRARDTSIAFYPCDVVGFFRHEDSKTTYGTAYLSNVLDWLRNEAGDDLDMSAKNMRRAIEPILERMLPNGTLIVNLQWSNRAKSGLTEALRDLGYGLAQVLDDGSGCGSMYTARRIG